MTKWTVVSLLVSMGLSLGLMLLLRPLLLRGFGPRAQYLAWLLVPVFTGVTMLPAPPVPLPLIAPDANRALTAVHQQVYEAVWRPAAGASAPEASAPSQTPWLLLVWWAGVGALGTAVVWQHRRWSRQLRWDMASGTWLLPAGHSPSVVGLLRPRLALPADFEQRFSAPERAGILDHEAVHARRHDNLWNVIATGFWIVNWFNPLAWWALRAFQRDQELACDAAALASRSSAERDAYRDALLKAFAISPSSALSRGWRSTHPLIERLRWVQSGFSERTLLSSLAVFLVLAVASAMAYCVHGGGIWQVWQSAGSAATAGHAQARVETLTQVNGDKWASGVVYMNIGSRPNDQILTWSETVGGRKVFNGLVRLARSDDNAPSAYVMVTEALDPARAIAGVPQTRDAAVPADRWQLLELATQAGDIVRLRFRFQMLQDPRQGI